MKYLLDANVFMDSHRRHYAREFCPGFWDWLDAKNHAGDVVSLGRIKAEILEKDDALRDWANARGEEWWLPDNSKMVAALSSVSAWVHNVTFNGGSDYYQLQARNKFFGDADYFLVGYALGNSLTVVTQEVRCNGPTAVKIPTVCDGLKVPCISMYELFRREGFILRLCNDDKCGSKCHS